MGKSNGRSNGAEDTPQANQQTAVSERKVRANQRNAKKSTGPRTARGKTYSRRNALTHGFYAKELFREYLIQRENPKEFEKLMASLVEHYKPVGPIEEQEVENIAVLLWRRRRGWRYENAEIQAATGEVHVRIQESCPTGDDLLPVAERQVLQLVDNVDKEFIATGKISKELEDKVLATDSSIFDQDLWRKCEGWTRIL